MDQRRGWARLWNDTKDYDVQLNLQVRELRGLSGGYAITRVDLLAGITVEDGTYNLQYSFHGRREKANVRVEGGTLRSVERGVGLI